MTKKYVGKIPEHAVKCTTKMLLKAIRAIHAKGYVHCDLKPANIFVFPPDRCGSLSRLPILSWLGQPKERNMLVVEACILNFPSTVIYMPPESVTTGKISPALDIWSLGCIVLEMITGKLPREYNNMTDLAIKIGSSRYSPKRLKTMSSTGKDFLMKCFERDPSERWTADMLLSHTFLLSEYPSLPSTIPVDCLPSMQELESMVLAILDDWISFIQKYSLEISINCKTVLQHSQG